MPNEQLVAHIRDEFGRGTDRAAVIRSLVTAGWKVEDINSALAVVEPAPMRSAPTPSYSAPVSPTQATYTAPAQVSEMKTVIQNTASGLFITCIFILTIVSIMGVWKIFSEDVIMKSFQTLGLLAFVAIVVIVASKFVGDSSTVAMPSPGFRAIRNSTLATLIGSSSLLALLGVLSIWDVITDKDILNKSLSSLAIIAFSSLIVVMVCLEREQNPLLKKRGKEMSLGVGIAVFFLIWILTALIR